MCVFSQMGDSLRLLLSKTSLAQGQGVILHGRNPFEGLESSLIPSHLIHMVYLWERT